LDPAANCNVAALAPAAAAAAPPVAFGRYRFSRVDVAPANHSKRKNETKRNKQMRYSRDTQDFSYTFKSKKQKQKKQKKKTIVV
jgi:hypothetical protein